MARAALAGLGEPGEPALLEADLTHIWANPAAEVDAAEHEQALRAALAMDPGHERDARLAAALADDGELLADEPYADWALRPRERLEALRQEARLALARDRARGAGDARPEAVLAAWAACAEHDPASEEAAAALVRGYFAAGHRELAVRAYERCRTALGELGLGLSPWLEEVYATAAFEAAPPRTQAPAAGGAQDRHRAGRRGGRGRAGSRRPRGAARRGRPLPGRGDRRGGGAGRHGDVGVRRRAAGHVRGARGARGRPRAGGPGGLPGAGVGGVHRRRDPADRGGDRPGGARSHRRRRPGRVRRRGRGRRPGRRAAGAGQAGFGPGRPGDQGRRRAPVRLGRGRRRRHLPGRAHAAHRGAPAPPRRPAGRTAARTGGARHGPARGGARPRLGRAGDRRARARQDPPGAGVPQARGPRHPVAGGELRLLRLVHALRPLPAAAGQLGGSDAGPARRGGRARPGAGAGRGAGRRPVPAAGPHDGPAAGSGAGPDGSGGPPEADLRRLALAGVPPGGGGPGRARPGGPALGRPDLAPPHPRPGPAGRGPRAGAC